MISAPLKSTIASPHFESDRATRSPRERLLAAAARHFYADGIMATGIDRIIAEAGVAKMSLYNVFGSKAELVVAYLEARHEEWLDLYRARLAESAPGRPGVLAVFDAYADHAEIAYPFGFRGCGLLNAAAELPSDHPGRAVVREHKAEVEQIIRAHVSGFVEDEPAAEELVQHLVLVLEGGMVRAGLACDSAPVHSARSVAGRLLGAA